MTGLKQRGFANPHKIVKASPSILTYAFKNIDAKLSGLEERGFTNLRKMVEWSPQILNYTFENIDDKLTGLKQRGFVNPHKMIESSPAILGYAFKNIDAKIRLLRGLTRLYNIPYTPSELMEYNKELIGAKIDKIVIVARVLREFAKNTEEVTKLVIKKTIISNLEDVLVTVNGLSENQEISLQELLKQVKVVKEKRMTKEKKREVITQGLIYHPKIKWRYFKGYPQRSL